MQKALLILALLAVAGFATYTQSIYQEWDLLWETWKVKHQKSYTLTEERERFAVFIKNHNKILQWNAENDTPKLALNKFADLTSDEFKATTGQCGFTETDQEFVAKNTVDADRLEVLPSAVDWRNKGAVTPVKNQGQCGSCWTFSTTGVLEGFHFVESGKLLSFSEQQIVDCDTDTNQGCDGGWPYLAIQYAAKQGLELESEYPYTAQDGTCKYDRSKATIVNSGYKFVTANSTVDLKTALTVSPISVLIEADQDVFQFYSSGVIKTGCGANLDHAVLAVGYTKVGLLEAFIVKNSWGADWGESGYVYIWDQQTQNNGQGVCGILAQPVVPTK